MTTLTINPATIATKAAEHRYRHDTVPTAVDLRGALDAAKQLFPDDHIFAACSGISIALDKGRDAITDEGLRSWYHLDPTSDGLISATAIDMELLADRGLPAERCTPRDDEWRLAQRWRLTAPIPGLEHVPAASSAICIPLQLGAGVRIFVVHNTEGWSETAPDPCFGIQAVRQFVLDVGFYESDPWKYAFIHRAVEVLGLESRDFSGELAPANVPALVAFANDDERRVPGNAAFDAMRTRWYNEFVAYAIRLADAGEIRMTESEIRDYAGVTATHAGANANFDGFFADGYGPEDALDEDRTYWDA